MFLRSGKHPCCAPAQKLCNVLQKILPPRSRDQQQLAQTETIQFGWELLDAADAEHHPGWAKVVCERGCHAISADIIARTRFNSSGMTVWSIPGKSSMVTSAPILRNTSAECLTRAAGMCVSTSLQP